MKIFFRILVVIFLLFQFTPSVFAHAGVQKRSKDFIITFYQYPISPLVGEKVKIIFVVTDHNLNSQ